MRGRNGGEGESYRGVVGERNDGVESGWMMTLQNNNTKFNLFLQLDEMPS